MKKSCLLVCIVIFICMEYICLADFGNLQDTCPTATQAKQTVFINGFNCKNPANIASSDFKTSNLNHTGNIDNIFLSAVTIATAADFPGLNTLGLSIARTDLEVDGLVLAHSHPRASEMFFVSKGNVVAGFIDTRNKVFQLGLNEGDVFVFPRGLLHFCFNSGFEPATVFSVLNSQNPGVVTLSGAMFGPDSDNVLDKLVRQLISLSGSKHNGVGNMTLAGFSIM
ncbi:germin-like protein subfamily 3 member 4 [Castanea sativa]|uniref:germin-like protein subfamily 3 member 4 n=1 Tax=Castanea sativa TaxID=21020 RepID=UPI003F65019D